MSSSMQNCKRNLRTSPVSKGVRMNKVCKLRMTLYGIKQTIPLGMVWETCKSDAIHGVHVESGKARSVHYALNG